ncbi:phosphoribosyltransferase family protein [uncultured Nocardioides sp.]|uniref:ComF family protein n=1 Tax=uncultured Nocardioides sp. TaxID=198441 RepID=UPI0026040CE1|nr:phosphoribosyltransferase family protein [uncultured Nocardioides sp.]
MTESHPTVDDPGGPLRVREAVADLLTGVTCLGCGRPGRLLCAPCRGALPTTAAPAVLDPVPPGLAPTWAAAPYDGVVRALVVGHKERRRLALRAPLADLLAAAVRAAAPGAGPVLLAAVPSRPAVVRARGHDPLGAVVALAARRLRHEGVAARVVRLLAPRGAVADQAGLDAAARAANLAGSLWCPHVRRLPATAAGSRLVVCDDVVTTGATLAEAQRALAAVGLPVTGHATVAATLRRHPSSGRPAPTGATSEPLPLPRADRLH